MKKWRRARSSRLPYFPENHSMHKWFLIICTPAKFGPCVVCSGCPRQPEQTLHSHPGLSLCPAFNPNQCPAHTCSCWATGNTTAVCSPPCSEVAQKWLSPRPARCQSWWEAAGQGCRAGQRAVTAQYFKLSSPCHSCVVILLPTSRIFICLFLMSSADGTKPLTASEQAASCLKFRTFSGDQWDRAGMIWFVGPQSDTKEMTEHTPHHFGKLQKLVLICHWVSNTEFIKLILPIQLWQSQLEKNTSNRF